MKTDDIDDIVTSLKVTKAGSVISLSGLCFNLRK